MTEGKRDRLTAALPSKAREELIVTAGASVNGPGTEFACRFQINPSVAERPFAYVNRLWRSISGQYFLNNISSSLRVAKLRSSFALWISAAAVMVNCTV